MNCGLPRCTRHVHSSIVAKDALNQLRHAVEVCRIESRRADCVAKLLRRGGVGSAGCASRCRTWWPRRGILPSQIQPSQKSEADRPTSQDCNLFSGNRKSCITRRRKTGIRMLKSGRITWSAAGCLGSVRRSHAGHKESLFAQPVFPVPSSARAFLAAGSPASVWNACLVSGNPGAVEEICKRQRWERS